MSGLTDLRAKYGKLTGLYLGPLRTVVINDYDLMVEAFSRDEFAARPDLASIREMRFANDFKKGLFGWEYEYHCSNIIIYLKLWFLNLFFVLIPPLDQKVG